MGRRGRGRREISRAAHVAKKKLAGAVWGPVGELGLSSAEVTEGRTGSPRGPRGGAGADPSFVLGPVQRILRKEGGTRTLFFHKSTPRGKPLKDGGNSARDNTGVGPGRSQS